MAASELSPSAQLTVLYGSIRSSVEQFASTAQLWYNIHESGIPATFQQVNELRSIAAGARNARDNFAAAETTQAITADMIGTAPWARSQSSQSLAPAYQLNIPYTYTDTEGNTIQSWVSKTVSVLPTAVGDLVDFANSVLPDFDTAPPDATVSGGIEILAV
jgi:hypothetical protein